MSPQLRPARSSIYQPDQYTVTQLLWQPSALGPLCLVTSSRERGSFLQPSTWVARGLESGHLLLSANHTWEGRRHRTFPWLLSDSQRRCEALTATAAGTGACQQLTGRCWKWGQGTWPAKKKKQGRWLTMWLIIASDCGGSQFSYLAKWNKTRSQSSSSSDKVKVPMAPFRVSQSGPPTSQRFRGNV